MASVNNDDYDDELLEYKPPFKLHFIPKTLLGRSSIYPNKPKPTETIISSKFYTKGKEDVDLVLFTKKLEQLETTGPREKYDKPVTESHKYGWHQVRFTDIDRSDPRLHFAKRTLPMIKLHLLTYKSPFR